MSRRIHQFDQKIQNPPVRTSCPALFSKLVKNLTFCWRSFSFTQGMIFFFVIVRVGMYFDC